MTNPKTLRPGDKIFFRRPGQLSLGMISGPSEREGFVRVYSYPEDAIIEIPLVTIDRDSPCFKEM